MPVNLKVLQATAEIQPLIKTGGLADVTQALTEALRGVGTDARLLMPAYRGIAQRVGAKPVSAPRMRLGSRGSPDAWPPLVTTFVLV